jgi:molybdate transport system substrate-binding protein
MIETGNAQLGLVALSQALVYQGPASFRAVPAALYDPIRQDAILLSRAKDNDAARQFLEFLKMPAAAAIMQRFGYAQPGSYD